MGRSPCCEKVGLKKGPWTPEEDQKLLAFIEQHGHGSWRALPAKAGLQRCGKSCRLRWTNYLRPDIKRGKFSLQEEQTIIQLHALLGNRWSAIATHLPKRTDNEIKNYWNTHLKKRLTKMGIDPVTHKPCSGSLCATTGLSHMAQWESARLEAEARLVRESKLLSSISCNNNDNNNNNNNVGNNNNISINKNPPLPSRPPCLDVLKAWQAQLGALSSTSSSCTSGAMKEASALSTIMALNAGGGDHLESPTSTLSFPPGGSSCMFPTMTTTMIENAMMLQEAKENCRMGSMSNIPILPLNDMSFYNESSSAWFGSATTAGTGNDDVNHVEGFADLLVGEYDNCRINSTNVGENYVAGAGNHVAGMGLDQENKNYWSNILMNLVTTSSSTSPPATGASPSHAVF